MHCKLGSGISSAHNYSHSLMHDLLMPVFPTVFQLPCLNSTPQAFQTLIADAPAVEKPSFCLSSSGHDWPHLRNDTADSEPIALHRLHSHCSLIHYPFSLTKDFYNSSVVFQGFFKKQQWKTTSYCMQGLKRLNCSNTFCSLYFLTWNFMQLQKSWIAAYCFYCSNTHFSHCSSTFIGWKQFFSWITYRNSS